MMGPNMLPPLVNDADPGSLSQRHGDAEYSLNNPQDQRGDADGLVQYYTYQMECNDEEEARISLNDMIDAFNDQTVREEDDRHLLEAFFDESFAADLDIFVNQSSEQSQMTSKTLHKQDQSEEERSGPESVYSYN